MAQQWIYYKISHLKQIHLLPANTALLFGRVLFEYTLALNLLVSGDLFGKLLCLKSILNYSHVNDFDNDGEHNEENLFQ